MSKSNTSARPNDNTPANGSSQAAAGGVAHTHNGSYTHAHDDGSVHTHNDAYTHKNTPSSHSHRHTNTKAVLNRMNRAIGHMEAVRSMIEDGRDCSEVRSDCRGTLPQSTTSARSSLRITSATVSWTPSKQEMIRYFVTSMMPLINS